MAIAGLMPGSLLACLLSWLLFWPRHLLTLFKLSIVAVAETGCASFCVALVSCLVAFALPTQAERRCLDTFPAQDASTRKATLTTGIANKLPSATKPTLHTLQYIPYLSISRVLNYSTTTITADLPSRRIWKHSATRVQSHKVTVARRRT